MSLEFLRGLIILIAVLRFGRYPALEALPVISNPWSAVQIQPLPVIFGFLACGIWWRQLNVNRYWSEGSMRV
jgi:hypothetical protein